MGLHAAAELAFEKAGVMEVGEPTDHWVFIRASNSRAILIDADDGSMKGMLSLGRGNTSLEFSPDGNYVYADETYYTRHTRGERTDVVTTYSMNTLSVEAEVIIPPRKSSGMPHREYSGLLDDGRIMLVNNSSPGTSVSVVDVRNQKFVEEIVTGGCALVYPNGDREFLQLCGDGTAQRITLTEDGHEKDRSRSKVFFDLETDPVSEQAARVEGGWLFITFSGIVHPVVVENESLLVQESWSLVEEDQKDWRPGGMQSVAYHSAYDFLLVLMHEGGEDTHKEPGSEVWVFNATTHRRLQVIKLERTAKSIAVSQDDDPLLYSAVAGAGQVGVYGVISGKRISVIENVGGPTIIQPLRAR